MWRCKHSGDWSPCSGGVDAGAKGDSYCADGYRGPRCELCDGPAYTRYFDKLEARCHDCGNVTARSIAAMCCAVLLLLSVFGLNAATHERRGSAGCAAATLRCIQSVQRVWQTAGMRFKLKVLVGFYQCIAAVPSVYNVVPPLGLEEYTRWIHLFEMPSDLENMFIASACLGDYRKRIVLGVSWPIVLVLVFAVGFVGWEIFHVCRRRWNDTVGLRGAVVGGLQRVLPMTLSLTFLVVPSTSTRIFRAFLCEKIEFGDGLVRHYLKADLALRCDSQEYEAMRTTAFAFVAVWPAGIPFLYAVLLWKCRAALRTHVPTPLTRATAFLWSDYTVYWWEPLEMCRKLVLTGWVLVIQGEAELARVIVALLISIAFLTARVSLKPLRR
jgi:hypothetical protein